MTDCNTPLPTTFKSQKPIFANFSGGDLSSDGGLLLARQADESLSLCEIISSCIDDPRLQSQVKHPQIELLRQRVLQIVAGYEDVSDANSLRKDPVFKTVCNRLPGDDKHLGSSSTLCRLENRLSKGELSKMRSAFLDLFFAAFMESRKRIVLDIDGYADPTHGQQELTFFNGFYRHYMYHPVMINDAASGFPLVLLLRAGNSHAGKGVKGLLRWLFWRIRKQFPDIEIVLRGDGGFSLPEIIDVCERSQVTYVLGFAQNRVLLRKNEDFMEQARVLHCLTGSKVRYFNDVYYKARTWSVPRRIVMKSEWLEQGPNQRFVVTNSSEDAQGLYDDFYVMRGEESENRIKEFKLDMYGDRLSCSQFTANQFRLMLHQMAFILMLKIRKVAEGTELAKARLGRIRDWVIKLAARVKVSVRRITIQLPTSCPSQALLFLLMERLTI